MINKIKNVCVIGSGVMGCNIAAHLTNAGLNVLLLDQASKNVDKNSIVKDNLNIFSKAKPSIFYEQKNIKNISVGNLDENIDDIKDYDWIIEAIIENINIKKNLFIKIDKIINSSISRKNILVSSNTSGLSVNKMCEETSNTFKENFLVTHFFNPVRYLHLLEIVPNTKTLPQNIKFISDFCERILGKGIILAKESPNFIANRIGVYAILRTLLLMKKYEGTTVEEVDYILGEQVGKPKSAVFKTIDLVGLETFSHVIDNCYATLKSDEEHKIFIKPSIFTQMIEKKLLGRKFKQGFYKKENNQYKVLNIQTCEYADKKRIKHASIEGAKNIDNLKEKLVYILKKEDKASKFIKEITLYTCIYAINRIFEISDSIEDIDNGMKWGFNWKMGPFETCDIIGINELIDFANMNKCKIPKWLRNKDLITKNKFYIHENNQIKIWCPITNQYILTKNSKNRISFINVKSHKKNILETFAVTNLIDLGDDIVACEFNTKLNSIDFDVLTDIEKSLDFCEQHGYKSLVLYNEGESFSVGMNLWLIFMGIQAQQWNQIESMCKKYQDICVRLKYSSIFTVSAPFNLTLGGGAELSMWCNSIEAHVELYMGLVEVGVGLIPGAGGNIELMSRALAPISKDKKIPLDIVLSKPLETIALAKIGLSAFECKQLGFLDQKDNITINKDLHLLSTKLCAMKSMNSGFAAGPRRTFNLPGQEGFSNFKLMLNSMYKGGFISHHDLTIALKVAYLVSGGDCNPNHAVDEQDLLDLERELFLSLCGETKTLERIEHMLKNKKPLRN